LIFERRPRIGDRGKLAPVATALLPEEIEVGASLERRAGLRGGDEERLLEIEELEDVADHRGMRRVEDVEALGAERPLQHLRREARAAHPEQDAGVEPVLPRALGELGLEDVLALQRRVEPAEPAVLVCVRPDALVARPDPADEIRGRRTHGRPS